MNDRRETILVLGIAVLVHVIAAWWNVGYLHPDEHFQVLEFALYKQGGMAASDMPWEFAESMRPGLLPFVAYTVANLLAPWDPFIIAFALRMLAGLVSIVAAVMVAREARAWITHPGIARWLLPATTLFWCLPVLHVRFSSETVSGALLAIGCCLCLIALRRGWVPGVAAGAILGLAFFSRFQVAFSILGLLAWLLLQGHAGRRVLLACAIGGLLGLAAGLVTDAWLYGRWVMTPLHYFTVNLLEGKAAAFGTAPWWYYGAVLLLVLVPPFSLVLLPAMAWAVAKHASNLLTWLVVPFVVVHIALGHKEARFLVPMAWILPVLVVLAADAIVASRWRKAFRLSVAALVPVNMVLLAIAICVPLQPIVNAQQWIYDHGKGEALDLWVLGESPYRKAGLTMRFYRAPGTRLHQVESLDAWQADRATNPDAQWLVVDDDRISPPDCKREYSVAPTWLRAVINPEVLSRYRVWSVYDCRPGNDTSTATGPA